MLTIYKLLYRLLGGEKTVITYTARGVGSTIVEVSQGYWPFNLIGHMDITIVEASDNSSAQNYELAVEKAKAHAERVMNYERPTSNGGQH